MRPAKISGGGKSRHRKQNKYIYIFKEIEEMIDQFEERGTMKVSKHIWGKYQEITIIINFLIFESK